MSRCVRGKYGMIGGPSQGRVGAGLATGQPDHFLGSDRADHLGLRVFYRTIGQGGVPLPAVAAATASYRHRSGRRFFTVFFIPLIPLNKVGEHIQCTTCRARYHVDVLSLPTAAQMQAALRRLRRRRPPCSWRGDPGSIPARHRAVRPSPAPGR